MSDNFLTWNVSKNMHTIVHKILATKEKRNTFEALSNWKKNSPEIAVIARMMEKRRNKRKFVIFSCWTFIYLLIKWQFFVHIFIHLLLLEMFNEKGHVFTFYIFYYNTCSIHDRCRLFIECDIKRNGQTHRQRKITYEIILCVCGWFLQLKHELISRH